MSLIVFITFLTSKSIASLTTSKLFASKKSSIALLFSTNSPVIPLGCVPEPNKVSYASLILVLRDCAVAALLGEPNKAFSFINLTSFAISSSNSRCLFAPSILRPSK